MSGAGPGELLDLAVSVATEAGRLLASGHSPGRPEVVGTKSSPTDVVTRMDRATEELIIGRIAAVRPGDAFLGEEGGAVRPAAARRPATAGPPAAGQPAGAAVRWIIDPIDGTVNYLYGLPDWAVSIAAERGGGIVAGVVHVPARGELFTAIAGAGAWLRTGPSGRAVPLRCNTGMSLSQALVATGFGYRAGRRAVQGEVVAALLPRVRDLRRSGSAAMDLCAVAAGRVDAYYERGINYWDRAAGGLIAQEAGARVAGLLGKPAGPELTIAASPGLFGELHALLAILDPERDANEPA
jgi:myo-inositol-1(or 4)-monophosphatase